MIIESFRRCYGRLPEATLLVSLEGRILEANAAARGLLCADGSSIDAWLRDTVLDTPEKVARLLDLCQRSRDLFPGSLTFRNGSPEGVACRVEGARFSMPDEKGFILLRLFLKEEATRRFHILNERIDTLNREVVERKRAETQLYAQRELLRRTAEFDEAVMSNMAEGLYTVDARGLATYINPAAEIFFGWTSDELRGKHMHEMTHHHHPDGTTFPAAECPGLQVLVKGHELLEQEDTFIRKDGSFFDVVYSSSPLRSGSDILGLIVVFRDVSESKLKERELRATNKALVRANEDLSQFAFAASHDLQEPLRMITSYSQLLIDSCPGQFEGEAALCLDFIMQGTARMRELLADLLAYTQVSESDAGSETTVVDLNLVFQKALENCKTAIDESGAIVTGDPLPSLPCYEPHFLQLFQNLIGNAIKYRSDKAPRIHISAQPVRDMWRLSVSDNGIGIAPAYQRKIFGVFKRLHGKELPGTGIGLAICQRVVERYGGEIWVESQLNEGSTFFCTFPISGIRQHEQ
jgi:PAS domain S-box-containing protein